MKPSKSLYNIRFKSYGSNSDFHVFGDLDLDLWHIPVKFLDNADIIGGGLGGGGGVPVPGSQIKKTRTRSQFTDNCQSFSQFPGNYAIPSSRIIKLIFPDKMIPV